MEADKHVPQAIVGDYMPAAETLISAKTRYGMDSVSPHPQRGFPSPRRVPGMDLCCQSQSSGVQAS